MKYLLLIVCVLVLAACPPKAEPEATSPDETAEKTEKSVDKKEVGAAKVEVARKALPEGATQGDGYAIVYPKLWEPKPKFMGTDSMAVSPMESDKDTFRENVNVVFEGTGVAVSPKTYYEMNLKTMKVQLENFKELSKNEITLKTGEKALDMHYLHSYNGMNIKVRAVFLTKGAKGYVITCSASPDSFNRFEKQFDGIVQTFQFK